METRGRADLRITEEVPASAAEEALELQVTDDQNANQGVSGRAGGCLGLRSEEHDDLLNDRGDTT